MFAHLIFVCHVKFDVSICKENLLSVVGADTYVKEAWAWEFRFI